MRLILPVTGLVLTLGPSVAAPATTGSPAAIRLEEGAYHVRPGQEIQPALELAARDPDHKLVRVHAGTYRPRRPAQAMIWFNERHDGITLEAAGEVTLTAANPELADAAAASFPAVVNHVVYFGDGVSRATVLRGFRITGANNFVTESEEGGRIEKDFTLPELQKGTFFYTDGGAIKIFGRSYPRLEGLEIVDNFADPCGGGISIEHRGFLYDAVRIRDSVFRGNRAQMTGSAVDLLPGSRADIENCLFVGNISNLGPDTISPPGKEYLAERGSGALTVFEGSRVAVSRSTFTSNWNGVDDYGGPSVYRDTIFWKNTAEGGISPGSRYELELRDGSGVGGCYVNGDLEDVNGVIDRKRNVFDAPDPEFDSAYRPRAPEYAEVGYRPLP